jgi:hypothetical protein
MFAGESVSMTTGGTRVSALRKLRKCFEPKLTPLQEDLLRLLEVPRDLYGLAAVGMDS